MKWPRSTLRSSLGSLRKCASYRHSTWASLMNGWRRWHWPWGFTKRVERRSASLWKETARLSTSACQLSTGWCAGRWDQAARSKYSRCLHRPHASSSLLTWISANKGKPGIQKIPQHLKHALEESSAYDHHWDLEEKKKETCFGVCGRVALYCPVVRVKYIFLCIFLK